MQKARPVRPLWHAIRHGHLETCRVLIDAGGMAADSRQQEVSALQVNNCGMINCVRAAFDYIFNSITTSSRSMIGSRGTATNVRAMPMKDAKNVA